MAIGGHRLSKLLRAIEIKKTDVYWSKYFQNCRNTSINAFGEGNFLKVYLKKSNSNFLEYLLTFGQQFFGAKVE